MVAGFQVRHSLSTISRMSGRFTVDLEQRIHLTVMEEKNTKPSQQPKEKISLPLNPLSPSEKELLRQSRIEAQKIFKTLAPKAKFRDLKD